jgi:hypothetical protein
LSASTRSTLEFPESARSPGRNKACHLYSIGGK